ncbi:SMP-30/gluconolactonase/LRE family protein [Labrys okinawensis]|uniref:SMP-30/gluconolactonase/LRE family protein n=1 Tax=Labrys okinawensis TaxID=346911 RepID=UPI0011B23CCB|nr:hypothetical protein [Labrys okinawensis]
MKLASAFHRRIEQPRITECVGTGRAGVVSRSGISAFCSSLFLATALLAGGSVAARATEPATATQDPAQALAAVTSKVVGQASELSLWENIALGPDGAFYISDHNHRRILRYADVEGLKIFAELPAYPLGLIFDSDGTLYVGAIGRNALTPVNGPDANTIYRIRPEGKPELFKEAKDARLLNGWVRLAPGRLLIADSIGGTIWQLDTKSGELTKFASDPLLDTPDPTIVTPAANGLKIHDGYLYISNTARKTIYRARLDPAGKLGPIEAYQENARADDIAFSPKGNLFYTTHQKSLYVILDGKSVEFSHDPAIRGSTALIWGEKDKGPYVVSDGGMFASIKYNGGPPDKAGLTEIIGSPY